VIYKDGMFFALNYCLLIKNKCEKITLGENLMKKLCSLALFIILAVPLFANASSCPANNVVTDAPLFQWTYDSAGDYYSGTLIMDEVTITLNNGETLTTRAYAQAGDEPSVPGPTIVMAPGKKYVLKFENRLPYEPLSTAHNTFKDPNVTNLHTHGLHTTGDTPGDDATRIFEGRTGGDYVFDITSDHMGGTFWIHAHHHGSTYLQISSGAFGMLLIDDANDGIPANVAAMEERLLTMGYLDPSVSGTGGDMLVSGTLSPGWNVNGTVDGNICMPVNTWQHWRLLVAAADVKAKDVSIGDQCEVALLARDGVWRTMVPKDLTTNTLSLTGGSRADIAVRCSSDSTLTVGGTVVANIYADPAGTVLPSVANPYAADGTSQWASFRPGYLRDLRNEPVTNFETVSMGARTINGSKFDILEPTFITQADGVQEWNVKGATNHPFHLHVFHFQAQTDCGEYEAGEYYDTIAASCNVRFDLNPQTSTVFEGKTIFHCHLLDHEDQGAMGYMVVLPNHDDPDPDLGTIPAPTFPVNAGFSEKYELDGGNPTVPADPHGLSASAVSSSQIDLSWTDNAADEDSYQVEQSLDGINFSVIAVLAADSTSYSDTGLSASTEYFYQVNASNAAGDSGYTNVASATTLADNGGGDPTSVEVGSITVSTANAGKGMKIGVADIVVVDDLGNPVEGAIVSGEFSGDINEIISASPATDANGQTSISTTQSAKVRGLTFCVTDIVDTNGVLAPFSGSVCGSL
jgi:FtsP/CotA-like multicopper oxidase with cupredoxin domain